MENELMNVLKLACLLTASPYFKGPKRMTPEEKKHNITGVHFMVRSRFPEYEVKKLRSPPCCRQGNAISPPQIHGTWSAP